MKILILVGPTAAGKTELALELAERLGLEIIGADSRQVYRRLDLGTAKPTPGQMRRVPHHLIDHVEPEEEYQAWRYQTEFRSLLSLLEAQGRRALVVGGTGLYIRAAVDGLAQAAPSDPELREALRAQPNEALHRRLADLDPASAAKIHSNDSTRLVRALELCLTTGQPASQFLAEHQPEPLSASITYLGLDWPRELLHQRIEQRLSRLLEQGWLDEVRELLASGLSPESRAMQSLGYRELTELLRGGLSLEEARARILLQTRRYAKRQMTWFRALPVHWLDPLAPDLLEKALRLCP